MAGTKTASIEIDRYSSTLKLMKFKIHDIPVQVFLGVPHEERATKQEILVSLTFKFDTQKAEQSDDIKDTIDYFQIYQFVQQFPAETSFCLLEHFHAKLGQSLKKTFPDIKKWEIRVQKFPFEAGSVSLSS